MVKIIGELGDQFPNPKGNFLQFSSPYFQAVYFINLLVRNQINSKEKSSIIKWLIENARPFPYAIEIYSIFLIKKKNLKLN